MKLPVSITQDMACYLLLGSINFGNIKGQNEIHLACFFNKSHLAKPQSNFFNLPETTSIETIEDDRSK